MNELSLPNKDRKEKKGVFLVFVFHAFLILLQNTQKYDWPFRVVD